MKSAVRKLNIHAGVSDFRNWLQHLFFQPVFIFVTLWGHAAILSAAFAFHHYEGISKGNTFLDSYYWAISIATTIGSDPPHTVIGKFIGIFTMVAGALFLWSYTALFAASLVNTEMHRVGREVSELESDMEAIEREIKVDEETLHELVKKIDALSMKVDGLYENRRI